MLGRRGRPIGTPAAGQVRAPSGGTGPGRTEYLAGPGGLGGEDRHRASGVGRKDLAEGTVLPLEDERRRRAVLAQRVELHRALHGAQRYAAVQVLDDLGIAGAPGGGDGL